MATTKPTTAAAGGGAEKAPAAKPVPMSHLQRQAEAAKPYIPPRITQGGSMPLLVTLFGVSAAAIAAGVLKGAAGEAGKMIALCSLGATNGALTIIGLENAGPDEFLVHKGRVGGYTGEVSVNGWRWMLLSKVEKVLAKEKEMTLRMDGYLAGNETVHCNLTFLVKPDYRIGDEHGSVRYVHLSHAQGALDAALTLSSVTVQAFGERLYKGFTREEFENDSNLWAQLVEIYARLSLRQQEEIGFDDQAEPLEIVEWGKINRHILHEILASSRAEHEASELERLTGMCYRPDFKLSDVTFSKAVTEAGERIAKARADAAALVVSGEAVAQLMQRGIEAADKAGITDPKMRADFVNRFMTLAAASAGQIDATGVIGGAFPDPVWQGAEVREGKARKGH